MAQFQLEIHPQLEMLDKIESMERKIDELPINHPKYMGTDEVENAYEEGGGQID